ncbi:hypothetical protein WG901_01845 [Novosphingobium sp. PS1R-30]|uniref:Uncharacterized protein n=1 Tax=Novosphingobium anseongense TaxID=3133436 RepID=A0ABU8RQP7_9SPHN
MILEIAHPPVEEAALDEQRTTELVFIVKREAVIAKNAKILARETPCQSEKPGQLAQMEYRKDQPSLDHCRHPYSQRGIPDTPLQGTGL